MASAGDDAAKSKNAFKKENKEKDKKLSPSEILERFKQMREEQRKIATKLTTLEMDKAEHKLVIETLSKLEPERKCFRLIGEILVERKVKNVLPALQKNLENLTKSIETSRELLVTKGKEITGFREKYNICIQGEDLSRIFNSGIALESPSTSSAKELKT